MAAGVSSQLLESLTPGNIAAVVFIFTISSFVVDFTWKPRYAQSLPRVGCGGSFLGTLQNWFYFVTRYNVWVAEGYEKVCYTREEFPYWLQTDIGIPAVLERWPRIRRPLGPKSPARDRRAPIPGCLDA